jgi:hypothetical protein
MSDDNPFGDLGDDPRDRMPRPKSAAQWGLMLLGLLIMTVGAFAFVVLAFLTSRGAAFAIGGALCAGGYAVFQYGERRRRRPRE